MINLYDVWWQLLKTNVCVFVKPIQIQSKIKLEFMYICLSGNCFAPVCTILPLNIAAVLSSKLMFSEN
jgi:hypothetical protein